MSGISFFIFTFWLQKFLEAIFYCIDFLLDFQETVWVTFFIYSQWLNNHINKTSKTSSSRFYPLNRLLGLGQSFERWTAKFVDKKKTWNTDNKVLLKVNKVLLKEICF